MPDVRKLLASMGAAEEAFRNSRFLAPCVRGGQVQARVAGIVCTFRPRPSDFQGWGIFQPLDGKVAQFLEEADLPLIERYLTRLPQLRLHLAFSLQNDAWLGYPANESDARQRWGTHQPIVVQLVSGGRAFEPIMARCDGRAWWFEDVDRRADPEPADKLRDALADVTPPAEVKFSGMTPEMRTTYDLVAQQQREFFTMMQQRRDEDRLRQALQRGGGAMRSWQDKGDFWLVEWTTRDGQVHASAIEKRDLTVMSSGVCLSGRDRDFDLTSLVGVIEAAAWDD